MLTMVKPFEVILKLLGLVTSIVKAAFIPIMKALSTPVNTA